MDNFQRQHRMPIGTLAAAFFLVDDGLAQLHTLAANVHIAGAFDEWAYIVIALATEGADGVAMFHSSLPFLLSERASAAHGLSWSSSEIVFLLDGRPCVIDLV